MLEKLRNSRFFRGVVTLASASAGGQLIMLAAMPFLTRLYTPEDFGVFAVFSALMGVLLVISSLRYELAIPLPKSQRTASRMLFIALGINLAIAVVTFGLVAILRFRIADWTETPLLASLLWLLPIAIVTGGTYKALNYWAVRNKDFQKIAVTKITQSSSNVIAQIIGGLVGIGAVGLIGGQVIGQSAGITRLWKGLSLKKLRLEASKTHSIALFSRYRNFPKYDAPAAAVNAVSSQLPNVAMALVFGPVAAGLFYLADKILAVPMSLVSQAVAQVMMGQVKEDVSSGNLFNRVKVTLMPLTFVCILVSVITILFAEPLFGFFFGEEWAVAGVYARWIVVGLSVQFLYGPLSVVLIATEYQHANLILHSFILVLKLLAMYAAYLYESQVFAVQLLSIALFIGYGVGVLVVVFRAKKLSGAVNA
ncbi:lipopolysaccharide biosynthesis protein [Idiomarina abyssalis]|uniref:lipopolysaccharide biosynthesis protein n=1 Tax=Idiomarina abyssalis TaxID=86102 RepID=UPI003A8F25AE